MDITNRIDRLLGDESGATTTANVAINTAKGHIDVIGGECPKGQKYDPKRKVCVPITNESKWKVQIKGVTHDWTDDSEYSDEKEAKKVMQKAIKAGRKKTHVRVVKESARSPKAGDRFEYKGKKLTIKRVGSGLRQWDDQYITVRFDGEKNDRDISIKNFFKGNNFKYIKETSVVGGSYISGTTTNIVGSRQTRTWGAEKHRIIDLDRKNKLEIISPDATIENLGRRGLKFNHLLGAYTPDHWEDTEYEQT